MAEQQKIKFPMRQDGTVTEEVRGGGGPDCEHLTKRVEERLGEVQNVQHKQEYYQQKVTTEEDVTLQHHQD